MAGLFNLRVWEVRPTLIDSPYSTDPIEDWSIPVLELQPYQVHMEPVTATEGDAARPQTITQYRMITPPGITAGFTSSARLKVEHHTTGNAYWHVVGLPGQFHTPFLAHSEFIVEKVEG